MKQRGASIRIYLADGSPDGLRLVEKANWTGLVLASSRAQWASVKERGELARAGIYVLIGDVAGEAGQPQIYVGEAEDLRKRIHQHQSKDFWTRLVVLTSKDQSLNKAHVRYLEARLLQLAAEAKQAQLENGTAPPLPYLAEADVDDTETFLDEALTVLPLLDVRAFDVPRTESASGPVLRLEGPDAKATGRDDPSGFIVLAGSVGRLATVPSIHSWLLDKREQLLKQGVLVPDNGVLRMASDYRFESPSAAAGVLLGRAANGRTEWKDAQGRTLKAIQAAAAS
jgi:predicted GIY-YIG superfamily endonuclease